MLQWLLNQHIVISPLVFRSELQSLHIHHRVQAWIYSACPCPASMLLMWFNLSVCRPWYSSDSGNGSICFYTFETAWQWMIFMPKKYLWPFLEFVSDFRDTFRDPHTTERSIWFFSQLFLDLKNLPSFQSVILDLAIKRFSSENPKGLSEPPNPSIIIVGSSEFLFLCELGKMPLFSLVTYSMMLFDIRFTLIFIILKCLRLMQICNQ